MAFGTVFNCRSFIERDSHGLSVLHVHSTKPLRLKVFLLVSIPVHKTRDSGLFFELAAGSLMYLCCVETVGLRQAKDVTLCWLRMLRRGIKLGRPETAVVLSSCNFPPFARLGRFIAPVTNFLCSWISVNQVIDVRFGSRLDKNFQAVLYSLHLGCRSNHSPFFIDFCLSKINLRTGFSFRPCRLHFI